MAVVAALGRPEQLAGHLELSLCLELLSGFASLVQHMLSLLVSFSEFECCAFMVTLTVYSSLLFSRLVRPSSAFQYVYPLQIHSYYI